MPKIVDHDERRAHIVDSLYRLLEREGFSKLSLRRIGTEAGYAHGAISRYFPNKQAVLAAAFEKMRDRWEERFNAVTEGLTGLEGLEALCSQLWPIGEVGHGNANIVFAFWNESVTDPTLSLIQRGNNESIRGRIRRFLEEARSTGEMRPGVDLDATARGIIARSMGWQSLAVLMPEVTTDEMLQTDVSTLVAGLRVKQPAFPG